MRVANPASRLRRNSPRVPRGTPPWLARLRQTPCPPAASPPLDPGRGAPNPQRAPPREIAAPRPSRAPSARASPSLLSTHAHVSTTSSFLPATTPSQPLLSASSHALACPPDGSAASLAARSRGILAQRNPHPSRRTPLQFTVLLLLVPQRHHRIQPRRPPCGQKSSQHSHANHQQRGHRY